MDSAVVESVTTRRSSGRRKVSCSTNAAANTLAVSNDIIRMWVETGLLHGWETRQGQQQVSVDSVERMHRRMAQSVAANASVRGATQAGRMHILVVEDDPALRRLYERYIERWPITPRVTVAVNGAEALVALSRGRVDMVITDLRMPDMDGFHLVRAIRRVPEFRDVQVVAVTGLPPEELAQRLPIPLGIPVLHKPAPLRELLTIASGVDQRLRDRLAEQGEQRAA